MLFMLVLNSCYVDEDSLELVIACPHFQSANPYTS